MTAGRRRLPACSDIVYESLVSALFCVVFSHRHSLFTRLCFQHGWLQAQKGPRRRPQLPGPQEGRGVQGEILAQEFQSRAESRYAHRCTCLRLLTVFIFTFTLPCTSLSFTDDSDVEDFIPHNSKVARQMMAIAEAKQSRHQKREKLAAKKRKSTGGADGLDGLDDSSGLPDGMQFSQRRVISKIMQDFMLVPVLFPNSVDVRWFRPCDQKEKGGRRRVSRKGMLHLAVARKPPGTC